MHIEKCEFCLFHPQALRWIWITATSDRQAYPSSPAFSIEVAAPQGVHYQHVSAAGKAMRHQSSRVSSSLQHTPAARWQWLSLKWPIRGAAAFIRARRSKEKGWCPHSSSSEQTLYYSYCNIKYRDVQLSCNPQWKYWRLFKLADAKLFSSRGPIPSSHVYGTSKLNHTKSQALTHILVIWFSLAHKFHMALQRHTNSHLKYKNLHLPFNPPHLSKKKSEMTKLQGALSSLSEQGTLH